MFVMKRHDFPHKKHKTAKMAAPRSGRRHGDCGRCGSIEAFLRLGSLAAAAPLRHAAMHVAKMTIFPKFPRGGTPTVVAQSRLSSSMWSRWALLYVVTGSSS